MFKIMKCEYFRGYYNGDLLLTFCSHLKAKTDIEGNCNKEDCPLKDEMGDENETTLHRDGYGPPS